MSNASQFNNESQWSPDPAANQDIQNASAGIVQAENAMPAAQVQLLKDANMNNTLAALRVAEPFPPFFSNGYTPLCPIPIIGPNIEVAARTGNPGQLQSVPETEEAAFHEFGHDFDRLLGGIDGATNLSSTPEFQQAFSNDMQTLRDSGMGGVADSLQSLYNTNPSDIVADIYAAEREGTSLNPNGDPWSAPNLPNGITDQKLLGYLGDCMDVFNNAMQNAIVLDNQHKVTPSTPKWTFGGGAEQMVPAGGGNPSGILRQYFSDGFYDPLIFDLSGSGITTTTVNDGIIFDAESTGFSHPMAWIGANDGVLFIDTDGSNDQPTQGNQIFGTGMLLENGSLASSAYEALAQYDVNNSGVINSSDPVFSDLRIWEGDGSVATLAQLGITSISLSSTAVNTVDSSGNTENSQGSFTRSNGSTGTVADYTLQEDTTDSYQTGSLVDISAAIASLPNAQGSGVVSTLQEAMQVDTTGELQDLVESFETSTSLSDQQQILREILIDWSGSQNAANVGAHVDPETFSVVEKFLGQSLPNPGVLQADLVYPAYSEIAETAYGQLMFSGALNDLMGLINITENANGSGDYDISAVANSLIQEDKTDSSGASLRLSEFIESMQGLGWLQNSNFEQFSEFITAESPDLLGAFSNVNPTSTINGDIIDQSAVTYNETVTASGSNDYILLGSANVTLNATGSNDWVATGPGNDVVYAGSNATVYLGDGNETVSVSGGNSLISAGSSGDEVNSLGLGNDVINFAAGSGAVTFVQGNSRSGLDGIYGSDSIVFGTGIESNDLILSLSGSDLIIGISGTNDSLDVANELATSGNKQVSSFEFADGTTLSASQFGAIGATFDLSDSNATIDHSQSYVAETDTVTGTNDTVSYGSGAVQVTDTGSNNTYRAGSGDLSITAGANDVIYAGSGNDTIVAGANNQITTGSGFTSVTLGANDSVLPAGYDIGSAEYILAEGTGTSNVAAGPSDTIVFGTGVSASDLSFTSDGFSLNISLNDANGDVLNLVNELTTPRSTEFEFANDTTYTLAQLTENGVVVTNSDDNVAGLGELATVNEQFTNTGSNDNISFGNGNDTIVNSGSSDTFITGSGTQVITDTGSDNTFNAAAATGTVNFTAGTSDSLTVYGASLTVTGADGDTINQIGSGSYSIVSGGDSTIGVGSGDGTITAGANDSINYSGNATISAGANDTISGVGGNGSITVGSDDTFMNPEDDTLYVNAGTGTTTINDQGGANDLIVLGAGITANDLSFSVNGQDLTMGLGTGSDTIQINNNFSFSDQYQFEFADDSTASLTELLPSSLEVDITASYGTFDHQEANNETVVLSGSSDTVNLGSGNDTVSMSGSSNVLFVGSGNAEIEDTGYGNQTYLGSGNDSVTLGTNSQVFAGNGTSDFYVSAGMGNAQLTDLGSTQTDTVYLEGYSVNDVTFSVDSNAGLVMNFGDGDSLDLEEFLQSSSDSKVANFVFDDATVSQASLFAMAPDVVYAVANDGTFDESSSTDNQYIFAGINDTISAGSGYTTIYGSGSINDTFNLGSGGSYVVAGTNDTIVGGSGDSYIYPVDGNATVTTGTGNAFITQYAGDLALDVSADSGNSVISSYNYDGSDTGNAVVNLGEGLDLSDMVVSESGNDLVIGFDDSDTTLTFQNQLANTEQRQITVNFEGGSSLSYGDLQSNNMLAIDNTTDSAFIDQPGLGWPVALTNEANNVYSILGANDFVTNSGSGDTFIMGAGNQSITDTGSSNWIDTTASSGTVTVSAGTSDTVLLGDGNNTVTGGYNDYIDVGSGNATLVSGGQSAIIQDGGVANITAGDNDSIYLNGGNATITGGNNDSISAWSNTGSINFTAGVNDTVYASQGNDTFYVNAGSGNTVIVESDAAGAASNTDTVTFGAGITANDISFAASYDDVELLLNGTDSLEIHEFAGAGVKQISEFNFADGSSYTLQQLFPDGLVVNNPYDDQTVDRTSSMMNETINLTGSGDTFFGTATATDEVINAADNTTIWQDGANVTITSGYNDDINGGTGTMNITAGDSNTIFQGSMNATIVAGNDDVIVGSGAIYDQNDVPIINGNTLAVTVANNDTIWASMANDTFNIGVGSGTTTINEEYLIDDNTGYEFTGNGLADSINFGTGIAAGDVSASQSGDELVLSLDSGDEVDINGEFADAYKQVTQFNFTDGTSETLAQALNAVSDSDDNYVFTGSTDQFVNLSGSNDTVTSANNDLIELSGTNDTVLLSTGSNQLTSAGGNFVTQDSGSSTIWAGANDSIDMEGGNALIYAGANDLITSSTANMTVSVGTNDSITVSQGTDQFDVDLGTASTLITETQLISNDSLVFGAGITANDLVLSGSGDGLTISFGSGDSVEIDHEFAAGYSQVSSFQFADGSSETLAELITAGLAATITTSDTTLDRSLSNTNETISLSGSNDGFTTGSGVNTIDITGANDTVTGTIGALVATLGGVNDTINASTANDAFVVNSSTGSITINESMNAQLNATDAITFGSGITANDLVLTGSSNDLNIGFGSDSVDINNEVAAGAKQISEFHFADGSSETLAQLLDSGVSFSNSADNLAIDRTQSTANETISLTGTNDAIQVGTGNDSITLGNSDTIYGSTGSLTVTAGSNDVINSSTTNDSITITADSGNSIINENSTPDNSSMDTLNFGAGISANDLTLSGGTDLKISFGSSSVDINNEFASGYKQITEFDFADGSSESLSDLLGLGMSLGIDTNDTALDRSGSSVNESISVSANNDSLLTGTGNDTITVSGTNDAIGVNGTATVTDTGSNNLIGGGSGALTATVGVNDTVYSSESNDQLYIGSGTGTTSVYETSYFSNDAQDTINFGAGITANDLVLSSTTNDLAITFDSSNDAVDIIGEFAAGDKQVTQFTFADGSSESLSTLIAGGLTVNNTNDEQTLDRSLSTVNETINDNGFDDSIYLGTGNDTVSMGGFNDALYGSTGNLTVNAGFNSTIEASSGQDTFSIGLPTESTVISETAPNSGTINDTISFGAGISQNDLVVSASSNDLLISVDSGLATVDILGEFSSGDKQVTNFQFADGSSESLSTLISGGITVTNTANDLTVDRTQSTANESITLSGNNDVLTTGSGNDSVTVGDNSVIHLGNGDTTLIAGANDTVYDSGSGALNATLGANDTINASQGNDVFTIAPGVGNAIIDETTPGAVGNNDTLYFTSAFNPNDAVFTQVGNDLHIDLGDGNDYVTVVGQFATGNKQVTTFDFADPLVTTLQNLQSEGVIQVVSPSTDSSSTPSSTNTAQTMPASSSENDVLANKQNNSNFDFDSFQNHYNANHAKDYGPLINGSSSTTASSSSSSGQSNQTGVSASTSTSSTSQNKEQNSNWTNHSTNTQNNQPGSSNSPSSSSFSEHDVNLLVQQMTAFGTQDPGVASLVSSTATNSNNVQLVPSHAA